MIVRRPSGFIAPCQPSKVDRPPTGPLWVHEIKHDGYRLMVRRDGARVRCFTRGGHDWADRFLAIVEAALRIQAPSFMLDGEAVVVSDDGRPDFHALRTRRTGHAVVIYAFDLIEHDGDDLRKLPLIERKWRLFKLIGKSQRRAIRFVEHLTGDGPTIFHHVCRMGLEGVVSKRTGAPYRGGPSRTWLKSKNPERGGAPGARGGVALSKVQSVDQRMRVMAFANCGRAVAHVRGSYVPAGTLETKEAAN
jgi:bifunctional non-homologous end joining protein LigD